MSQDLLDADCVIGHLCGQNVISMTAWRNTNPSDNEFPAYFDRPSTNGRISLWIIRRSGNFFVSRSSVAVLSCRHRFDPSGIYTACAVKPGPIEA